MTRREPARTCAPLFPALQSSAASGVTGVVIGERTAATFAATGLLAFLPVSARFLRVSKIEAMALRAEQVFVNLSWEP